MVLRFDAMWIGYLLHRWQHAKALVKSSIDKTGAVNAVFARISVLNLGFAETHQLSRSSILVF